jgi:predicted acetyltransferase
VIPVPEAPDVSLQLAVPADEARLDRLYQLYLHDLSVACDLSLSEDARYDDGTSLMAYLEPQPDAKPYLIRVGGALAGFVLIDQQSEIDDEPFDGWRVAEMFVALPHRRRGVGDAVIAALCRLHPGHWMGSVREGNPGAAGFGRAVVQRLAPRSIREVPVPDDGETRLVIEWRAPDAPWGA